MKSYKLHYNILCFVEIHHYFVLECKSYTMLYLFHFDLLGVYVWVTNTWQRLCMGSW